MNFTIEKSIEILERTPEVLETMLRDLSEDWTENNEGGETWSVFDVLGHLVHGEKTDWVARMEIILSDREDKRFNPFDRFAQFEDSKGKTLQELLDEFKRLRKENIKALRSKKLTGEAFGKKGIHPAFGEVTLAQLLATWTVHDLDHISQISRVMAKQYKEAVGPWVEYLRILNS
jgi:uncharacterized damage-inducible protein DinB